MAIFHQSDLSAWSRCAAEFGYKRAGLPSKTNSAAAYGSVMHHCFAGEVEYLTPDGPKSFQETAGTTQQVLTRRHGASAWVEAPIREFGAQPLMQISLQRGRRVKTIRATPEHRWFVCTRADRASEVRIVVTADLQVGDRLAWQFPRCAIGRTAPMATAVGAGIVFGDGTKEANQSRVDLWGVKQSLTSWFPAPTLSRLRSTKNGVTGTSVRNLPLAFKDLPTGDEGIPYLYGWLAGWLATDGCVAADTGAVTLTASDRKHLEFARAVAMRLGIATNAVTEVRPGGFSYATKPSYCLSFIAATVPPTLLVRDDQRQAFERFKGRYLGWRVVEVADLGAQEPVYCAVVDDSQAFVLEDWIYTGNSLEVLERALHQHVPFESALASALETFAHYWSPLNIDQICAPVPPDGWLPRQGYSELRRKGLDTIRQYADLIRFDDHELLATEYPFIVPIDGTWDDEAGQPHWLAGSIDRLAARYYLRQLVLCVDDYKSGREYVGLRHNIQFTAYGYATTKREFWVGARGEDGFGDRGEELFQRFNGKGRRGTWINLRTIKFQDAGWRGPTDYHRFALAVTQMHAAMQADIYPLSISGAVCKYCDFRSVCGGTGIATEEHGNPVAKDKADRPVVTA